jgi:ubiquinone/menaquinone biosynthesis C-methylase UbiE
LQTHARRFVPAAGVDWLLPFYDAMWHVAMREKKIRGALLDAADIRDGARVLDLGCGTGSLVVMLKARQPAARVAAIDPDPKALAIARGKAERAGAQVEFQQAFGDSLPFEAAAFDRAVSSFMFHHLTEPEKDATLREVHRVLAPGGTLHVLDFAEAGGGWFHALAHRLHGGGAHDHHPHPTLSERMRATGFAGVAEITRMRTLFGTAALHRGERPA